MLEEHVMPSIAYQNDQEAEDLNVFSETKKPAEHDNLAWAERQYPSPDPSILEAFLTNSVNLPVENVDSSELEGVEQSHEISFAATANERPGEYSRQMSQRAHQIPVTLYMQPVPSVNNSRSFDKEYCSLEPVVLSQLQKQQDDRFHDFNQLQVPTKLQTAFSAGLLRPANTGIH